MEDTLRVDEKGALKYMKCLNPCFNGRYSQRLAGSMVNGGGDCLNPYFNGRYSQRYKYVTPNATIEES